MDGASVKKLLYYFCVVLYLIKILQYRYGMHMAEGYWNQRPICSAMQGMCVFVQRSVYKIITAQLKSESL
jgi:hypothetical protein